MGWVTGDEVYGGGPKLRAALEERGFGYVLAVACSAEVPSKAGKFRADRLVKRLPKRAWQKVSAETGAKGHRFYDWAVIDLAAPRPGRHQLLIPPQPHHRRARLLPLLLTPAGAADRAGSRWPDPDGGRRRPSGPRKDWPDSTSTRSAATRPGVAGSPSPCSRMPSSPSSAPTNTHTAPHRPTWPRCPATRSSACSSRSSSDRSTTQPTGSAGPAGDAAIKPGPAPDMIGDKPHPRHEDHDLQLECKRGRSCPTRSGSLLRMTWNTPHICLTLQTSRWLTVQVNLADGPSIRPAANVPGEQSGTRIGDQNGTKHRQAGSCRGSSGQWRRSGCRYRSRFCRSRFRGELQDEGARPTLL